MALWLISLNGKMYFGSEVDNKVHVNMNYF